LLAFQEKDAEFFFGRETFVDSLVQVVQQQPLVAVIGSSGSGKSSVVLAGLIPKLGKLGNWLIADFRPNREPFYQLAKVLVPLIEPKLSKGDQRREASKLEKELQQENRALQRVVEDLLQEHPNSRLLLIVDQFEELYTLCGNTQEQQRFVDILLAAVQSIPRRLTLVLTLRADFFSYILNYPPFGEALRQYPPQLLSPMNREEMRLAIERPAEKTGVKLEEGLTERILDDVKQEPGNLPLLEFALTQLWAKQSRGQLTHQAYSEIGEVAKALSNHAEAVYAKLSEEEQKQAQRIFLQLVRPGEGTEDTRRVATRAEVGNWELVTFLAGAEARLVVTGRDEQTKETVEVVHEALIREWERLREWMKSDRTFRTWQERLRVAMRQWEATGKDEAVLLRGVLLAEAEDWRNRRLDELSPEERVFIHLSLALRDREKEEQERRRRRTILGLIGGLVGASTLAGAAMWQWQQAEIGQIKTITKSSELLIASNKQFDALIESLKAGKRLKGVFWAEANTRTEVVRVLRQAVYQVRERNRLEQHKDIVTSLSFSPDGQTIASASFDKTIKLWKHDGTLLNTLKGHRDVVQSVTFSPDGQTIASASFDKTIKLWKHNGTLLKTLKGHRDVVTSVSFSPDGQTIASGSFDKTIKLWKHDGTLLNTLKGHGESVISVSFSHDGKTLASASRDKTVKLWSHDGQETKILKGHGDWVNSVSFSPDGQTLASTSADKTIKLWKRDGTLLKTLKGHGESVISVNFSHDSKILASVSRDKTVKLWSRDGQELTTLQGHGGSVNSVSFRLDGQTLASASADTTVKLWSFDSLTLGKTLTGHSKEVIKVSFSPDAKSLASAGLDNTIKLWSRDGKFLKNLEGHGDWVTSLSFNPDNQILASASQDNTIKLWSRDGTFLKNLEGHNQAVNSVSFSPDGQTLASASEDKSIKLWSRDGTFLKNLEGHSQAVNSVSFSPDGKTLASASSDKTIKLWNLADGKVIKTLLAHNDWVWDVSYSPDGKTLASVSRDTTVKLWNPNGTLSKTLQGHTAWVWDVTFSPDSQTLASASDDTTVKLWSRDGQELVTLRGHQAGVWGVSFSPDGQTVASASSDATVKLWSSHSSKLHTINLDDLLVYGCNWLNDYLKTNPYVSESNRQVCPR
jgi:WD40 repeat protein